MMLYDPLTYDNLMAGLVVHFEKQPKELLSGASGIEGPGVYACTTPAPIVRMS